MRRHETNRFAVDCRNGCLERKRNYHFGIVEDCSIWGVQAGILSDFAGQMNGIQAGSFICTGSCGLQIGLVNRYRRGHAEYGVSYVTPYDPGFVIQIGLVNRVNDRCSWPLVNVVF